MLRGSSGGLSLAVFHLNSKKQKLYRLASSTVDADRDKRYTGSLPDDERAKLDRVCKRKELKP